MNQPLIIEWCATGEQRGVFHIDTLDKCISDNLKLMTGKTKADAWIPVAVCADYDEAYATLKRLRNMTGNE